MPNKRDIKLDKYNISQERYRELKYFCLQYPQWKKSLEAYESSLKAATISDIPSSHKLSDTTGDIAVLRADLSAKCEIVEKTAIEVNPYTYQFILRNVTEGISYEYLDVYCGRRQFYEDRRKFFYLLSRKKG